MRTSRLCLLFVLSCVGATEPPWGTSNDTLPLLHGELTLDATYRVGDQGNVLATLWGTNTGPIRISGVLPGQCYAEMRAYQTQDRTGEPLWQDGDNRPCRYSVTEIDLAPGERTLLGPERALFGARNLLPGTTYLSARVIFSDPASRTRELPAGSVTRETLGY